MEGLKVAMVYELFLGLRYLKAKRKQAFISVITVISALGITVGVMSLVVVLSVMNGFKADLTSKIMGVHAHLLVLNHEGLIKNHELKGVSPFISVDPFLTIAKDQLI